MDLPEWVMAVDLEVDASIERDFDEWYDRVHLPEIVGCPGFVSGTRLKAGPHPADGPGLRRMLTIYEVESPEAWSTPEFAQYRGLGPFGSKINLRNRMFRRHITLGRP